MLGIRRPRLHLRHPARLLQNRKRQNPMVGRPLPHPVLGKSPPHPLLHPTPRATHLTAPDPPINIHRPRNRKRPPRLRQAHLGHTHLQLPLQDAPPHQHLRHARHPRLRVEQDLLRHNAAADKHGLGADSSLVRHRLDERAAGGQRAAHLDPVLAG